MSSSNGSTQDRIDLSKVPAVIMAGGKGTRLAEITGVLPKPMVNIRGTQDQYFGQAKDTILEDQIDVLSQAGITEFILVVGNKKAYIQEAFTNETINRDLPGRNITIRYFEEEEQTPLGTGGSFCSREFQEMVAGRDFLLVYADVLFRADIGELYRTHVEEHADLTMLVGPSKAPDDRVLCEIGPDGKEIIGLIPKQGKGDGPRSGYFPNTARNGITLFSPRVFEPLPQGTYNKDMEADIFPLFIFNPAYKVCACQTPCYLKDIGTVERFREGVRDLEMGIPDTKDPSRHEQSCVIFKESDLYDAQGRLSLAIGNAISVLNEAGVIVGLQQDVPEIDYGPLGTKKVDTDLVRNCNGAFVNFRFEEEDVNKIISVMESWNIPGSKTYVIERVLDSDYLICNFDKGDQSLESSPMAATFAVLAEIENLRAEQAKVVPEIPVQEEILEDENPETTVVDEVMGPEFGSPSRLDDIFRMISQENPELGDKLQAMQMPTAFEDQGYIPEEQPEASEGSLDASSQEVTTDGLKINPTQQTESVDQTPGVTIDQGAGQQ